MIPTTRYADILRLVDGTQVRSTIDLATGQIIVKANDAELDHESKPTHTVTVTATDSHNDYRHHHRDHPRHRRGRTSGGDGCIWI